MELPMNVARHAHWRAHWLYRRLLDENILHIFRERLQFTALSSRADGMRLSSSPRVNTGEMSAMPIHSQANPCTKRFIHIRISNYPGLCILPLFQMLTPLDLFDPGVQVEAHHEGKFSCT